MRQQLSALGEAEGRASDWAGACTGQVLKHDANRRKSRNDVGLGPAQRGDSPFGKLLLQGADLVSSEREVVKQVARADAMAGMDHAQDMGILGRRTSNAVEQLIQLFKQPLHSGCFVAHFNKGENQVAIGPL
jgi:hypothetical protein